MSDNPVNSWFAWYNSAMNLPVLSPSVKAHIKVFLATLLIAGSFPASAHLAPVLHPLSLTLMRFFIALVALSPFVLFDSRKRQSLKKLLPRASLLGLFYAGFFVAMFEALKTTQVLNTASLYTLVPFVTALLAWGIFKEPIKLKKIGVFALGVFGTLWVIFEGDSTRVLELSFYHGDKIFAFGALLMCFYSIGVQYFYREDNPIVLVYGTLVGGCMWMGVGLVVFNIPLEWHLIQGGLVFSMGYLAIGTTLLTLYLLQGATVTLGSVRVMSYVYLNPAVVAFFLFATLGKTIPAVVLPGIVLSAIATLLLQRSKI